ncbi:uncharacterized protein METZ01_LOCUS447310, partial [marine metagenome]
VFLFTKYKIYFKHSQRDHDLTQTNVDPILGSVFIFVRSLIKIKIQKELLINKLFEFNQ